MATVSGSTLEENHRAVTKELAAVFQDIPLDATNSLEDRWDYRGGNTALWGRCNGKLVLGIFHFLREIVTILRKNSLSLSNSLSFAKIPLVKIVHVGKI